MARYGMKATKPDEAAPPALVVVDVDVGLACDDDDDEEDDDALIQATKRPQSHQAAE